MRPEQRFLLQISTCVRNLAGFPLFCAEILPKRAVSGWIWVGIEYTSANLKQKPLLRSQKTNFAYLAPHGGAPGPPGLLPFFFAALYWAALAGCLTRAARAATCHSCHVPGWGPAAGTRLAPKLQPAGARLVPGRCLAGTQVATGRWHAAGAWLTPGVPPAGRPV